MREFTPEECPACDRLEDPAVLGEQGLCNKCSHLLSLDEDTWYDENDCAGEPEYGYGIEG